MTRERSWPSLDEVREKAKKHVLDDRMAAVPPYELEDWEILGNPAPGENAATDERPAAPKSSHRRRQRR
jgi:hypothetical protein